MKIGIDIGGSHIGVGLVDDVGKIVVKKDKDLLKDNNKIIEINEIVNKIQNCIQEIINEQKINLKSIEMIGIAFPASLRKGKFGLSVNLGIEGLKLKDTLEKYYSVPIYMKNDAKCAALCEKKYGSLKQYSNAVFLTIGTGIGGAVFFENELLKTEKNDLFKIGHITIKKDGLKCKCGKRGCFEKYASISALKREVKKEYHINRKITGLELYNFIMENNKDEKMKKIIEKYIENLCIGISTIINLFEPEAISIGGSFAHYEDIFLDKLKKKLEENNKRYNDSIPKILLSQTKNDAGIIGACIDR